MSDITKFFQIVFKSETREDPKKVREDSPDCS